MTRVTLSACVDGLESDDSDSPYAGDGAFPPFRIFIPNAQAYLCGEYETRDAAQAEADRINGGLYAPLEMES
jgi:hypothetical protein